MIRELNQQNAAIRTENEHRRERIGKLESSPSEQEMEIRKQLKLAHPNDTTFMLPTTPSPNPADNASPDNGPASPAPQP